MDTSWIEAARRYGTFDERARADYWGRLNSEQQNLLMEALATLTAEWQAAANREQAPIQTTVGGVPKPRGLFGHLAIGCGWMFLGGVITVALEIAAVSAGIGAISELFSGSSSSYSTGESFSVKPDYLQMDCGPLLRDNPDQYEDCVSTQKVWREQEEHNQKILHPEDESE